MPLSFTRVADFVTRVRAQHVNELQQAVENHDVAITSNTNNVAAVTPTSNGAVAVGNGTGTDLLTAGAAGSLYELLGGVRHHRAHYGITVASGIDTPAWQQRLADYVGDGVHDDVALQNAIEEAQGYIGASGVYRAPVIYLMPGRYHWTSPVIVKSAPIQGAGVGLTTVYWDGTAGASVITKPATYNGGKQVGGLSHIRFYKGTAEPGCWVDLTDTAAAASTGTDVFFQLDHLWFSSGAYHIKLGAYVNVHWHHLRFDAWTAYAIDLAPPTDQFLSDFVLDDWTCDNKNATTGCKGFMHLTVPNNAANVGTITLRGFRCEMNMTMAAPQAFFCVTHPSTAGSRLFTLHLNDFTYQDTASNASDVLFFRDTTNTSAVDSVTFENGKVSALSALFGGTYHAGWVSPAIPNGGNINRISTGGDTYLTFGQEFVYPSSNTSLTRSHRITGDTSDRYSLDASGKQSWGSGTAAADTFLYRSGAGVLRTDGAVRVQAVATASRPSAATVGAGGMVFDTTLNKPIWSDGTNWRDASGTTV